MKTPDRKKHWENIYATKDLKSVSWYQSKPRVSLQLIAELHVSTDSKIIDIGGGDSLLVDNLLDLGFKDITVLDVSEKALERAKTRLGHRANDVKWIRKDVTLFDPDEKYDLWHDRAAFHFLTEEQEIDAYVKSMHESLNVGGKVVIGTFSKDGPIKCSGIDITQYDMKSLSERFGNWFDKIHCMSSDHETPSHKIQNFIFCSFQKKSIL